MVIVKKSFFDNIIRLLLVVVSDGILEESMTSLEKIITSTSDILM